MSGEPFVPAEAAEGFHTHPADCPCAHCTYHKRALTAKQAYLGDVEHTHSASTPDHGTGIYINGHSVQVLDDWSDD